MHLLYRRLFTVKLTRMWSREWLGYTTRVGVNHIPLVMWFYSKRSRPRRCSSLALRYGYLGLCANKYECFFNDFYSGARAQTHTHIDIYLFISSQTFRSNPRAPLPVWRFNYRNFIFLKLPQKYSFFDQRTSYLASSNGVRTFPQFSLNAFHDYLSSVHYSYYILIGYRFMSGYSGAVHFYSRHLRFKSIFKVDISPYKALI